MKKVKSILLIDDDETTNIINEMLIMDMGAAEGLLQARNGRKGIEVLQDLMGHSQDLPELILLDVNMPVMDGFAFLDAFKEIDFKDKASPLIVMLTTSLNPSDMERAKKAGVSDYLNKPLTEQSLQRILNKHFAD